MVFAAFMLVKVLRLTGVSQIVVSMFLPCMTLLSGYLAETPLAGYMGRFYNTAIMKLCSIIGISSACQISRGTGIAITFWLLFLIILLLCNETVRL